MDKASYLVTGGAGFIGSHIVDALLKEGYKVRVLDNLSTGKKENLKHVLDRIEFIQADIRDESIVRSAVKDVDYILHQAAIPSVQRSFDNPYETLSVNAGGTLQLLTIAKDNGVKCFVYASSSSVYGKASPYGISKLLGEQYCMLYHRLYGLNTVCLRYFNVFGPRQDPNSQYSAVIPRFIHALKNNQPPIIYGDGKQSRDFTYITNVVNANLYIRKPGIYDIGCGRSTSINELLKMIMEIMGVNTKPIYAPPRKGDVRFSCANLNSPEYQPVIYIEEGLRMLLSSNLL